MTIIEIFGYGLLAISGLCAGSVLFALFMIWISGVKWLWPEL